MNHGAFGLATNQLLAESNLWRYYCELQPLRFFDRDLMPLVAMSVREMAKHLSCPAHELLPLPNVTSGLNSIFGSVRLAPGDEILCSSLTYGSTKKMLAELAARRGATVRTVNLPLSQPLTKQFILKQTAGALSHRTRLVVIDQVTSNTAVVMPTLERAAMCRAAGAVVVVDAAHSLFAQEVSLYEKDSASGALSSQGCISEYADFWLSNAHKWMCNPKGCAFVWVSPGSPPLRPAILSHGFAAGQDGFASRERMLSGFAWDGCRDYAALLTISSAIRHWSYLDAASCRMSNSNLLAAAVEMLRAEWGVAADDVVAERALLSGSPMALVPLPASVAGSGGVSDNDAFRVQEWLHHEHLIEAPVKCLEGRLYVRISAHIYNCIADYQRLAWAVRGYRGS